MIKTVIITSLFYVTAQSALQFSERVNNFGVELLHFTQQDTNGHLVISPFGVWSLMSGLALGAAGPSRSQLAEAFRLPANSVDVVKEYQELTRSVLGSNSNGVTMTNNNFLFLDEGFNINYKFEKIITEGFGAVIQNLNFKDSTEAAYSANSIIQSTGASVSNVFEPSDFADSSMIITNVIVFKGFWTTPFNSSYTKVEPFYDENMNEIGEVNMMNMLAALRYTKMDELQSIVLEMPYGDDQKYCMLILIPLNSVGVNTVYMNLAKVSFPSIFEKLKEDEDTFGVENIKVKLPRFKISTDVKLNEPLNNMGVTDIFNPDLADFNLISDDRTYVTAIVQKADIEVTEIGTEASASTSVFMSDRLGPTELAANKPFLFFVVERSTATVLFSGIYSKPSIF